MASSRLLRSLSSLTTAPRLAPRAPSSSSSPPPLVLIRSSRRFLNVESAPVLATARARVVGARTGHVHGDDLDVGLTMAKTIGGAGEKGKTNPEELFAAGYGACFQSAMSVAAGQLGLRLPKEPEDSVVESTVHLVGSLKDADMAIRVDMKVKVRGLDKQELEKVVAKAEEICPYSRATRGNVPTNIEVESL